MSDFEPSDWKNTKIPKLAQLDSLQRCLICKDFLKAPVITSCNHTFCSQCIRQHLMSVSRCPLCKTEQFESNLKRVILLEEIVLCFQALRNDLITLVGSQPETPTPSAPSEPKNIEVIEIPDDVTSSGLDSTSKIEEKLDPGYVHCPVCGEVMKKEHVQGSHLDYCLNGKPDPKLIPKTQPVKRKANDVLLFFQSQKLQKKKPAGGIDHENFYFKQGEKHHHDTKRIPKIDFTSLSAAKVKEKLASYKLSTVGSRADLEWRYNQYYLLHQSNLDSSHPLTEMELRQKLKQWEVSRLVTPASNASNTIYGDSLSRKCISDKDFPIKAWLDFYKDEFKTLVKQARKSRKRQNLIIAEKPVGERVSTPSDDITDAAAELEIPSAKGNQIDPPNETLASEENTVASDSNEAIDFDFSKSTLFTSD